MSSESYGFYSRNVSLMVYYNAAYRLDIYLFYLIVKVTLGLFDRASSSRNNLKCQLDATR